MSEGCDRVSSPRGEAEFGLLRGPFEAVPSEEQRISTERSCPPRKAVSLVLKKAALERLSIAKSFGLVPDDK
jgi:hypothetical protein